MRLAFEIIFIANCQKIKLVTFIWHIILFQSFIWRNYTASLWFTTLFIIPEMLWILFLTISFLFVFFLFQASSWIPYINTRFCCLQYMLQLQLPTIHTLRVYVHLAKRLLGNDAEEILAAVMIQRQRFSHHCSWVPPYKFIIIHNIFVNGRSDGRTWRESDTEGTRWKLTLYVTRLFQTFFVVFRHK